MKRKWILTLSIVISVLILFRVFCGIFVIQPIGAVPKGATIVYWRAGLNLPFIASADGLLAESGAGVSLLGRGLFLAKLAEPITKNEIFRFGYSNTIYLWSTGGVTYEN